MFLECYYNIKTLKESLFLSLVIFNYPSKASSSELHYYALLWGPRSATVTGYMLKLYRELSKKLSHLDSTSGDSDSLATGWA